MILSLRSGWSLFPGTFLLLLLLWPVGSAAQVVDVEVLERRADGVTLAFEIRWNESLASLAADGAPVLDAAFVQRAGYGWPHASETVTLPSLDLPQVSLIGTDYEEIRVASAEDQFAAALNLPAVEVGELGLHRRQPAASVIVNLVTYDESRYVVRRYRRLVVAVQFASVPSRPLGAALQAASNPHLSVSRSILADGTTFRIPVREEGIYRIDRDFLTSLGLAPGSIDPAHVRVFTNGGRPLPALNSAPRPADLVETPTFVRGGGDGSFGPNDVVLFYAAAPSGWNFNPATDEWEHFVNPFSSDNFVFVRIDNVPSRQVNAPAFPDLASPAVRSSVTGRFFRDMQQYMWSREAGSGLNWVSEPIRGGGRLDVVTNHTLPGLQAGEVRYRARVAIASNPIATAHLVSGTTVLQEFRGSRIGNHSTDPAASAVTRAFTQQVTSPGPINLSMTLQQQTGDPSASFDWVRIAYPQNLRAENGWLRFATPGGEAGAFEFTLTGFTAEPQVWDVTEPGTVRRLGVRQSGTAYRTQIEVGGANTHREIVAFTEAGSRSLATDHALQIAHQNLHGIQEFPQFVIVAPEPFLEQAERLADRRRGEGMTVIVTSVEQIYNEFAGGIADMRAVRDYFKFLYDRTTDDSRMLRYALLFGDGHFNFRGLGSSPPHLKNWIPPYQTDETFHPEWSYTSDDYFGLLDDHEGVWTYSRSSPGPSGSPVERVDIGVGRLPVQTVEEARMVVDKIFHYESSSTFGPWRSRYLFTADNGYTGQAGNLTDFDLHVQNADVVAEMVRKRFPVMNIRKVYATNYEREYRSGWRIPGANRDIMNALEDGVLLFNFAGHGSPNVLTQERIFTREDAMALTNYDRLSIFVTATCSFGRWDMDHEQSGAELLLLNPNGGAVALMTTVRLVYTIADTTTLNVGLNMQLNRDLLQPGTDGRPRRLGDALRLTKNTSVGLQGNNRKFNLLGDPTMRIGLPDRSVAVTSVGGHPLDADPAPIRALDRLTIAGEVRTPSGEVDGAFNGTVNLTVFDAQRQVMLPYWRDMPTPYFLVREDLIWRGDVTAQAGRFEGVFVVPKDISYSNRAGRISAYAHGEAYDAGGATENVIVGGTSPNPPDDSEGPLIRLFLNDTTFVSGGLTTRRPELIVRLWDESGINTVGAGVGHEILLIINDDEQNAVDISGAFQSDPNSYQSGVIRWRLPEQAPGANRLTVRAWDVLNNSSMESVAYRVVEDERLRIVRVYNYPNPTTGPTRFVFEHNQAPGTAARVQVRIFTLNGRPVRTIDTDEALPAGILPGGIVQIPWNGLDEDFDRLGTGIYLYRVRVEVDGPDGERQTAETIERLAVIR
jgi:hypothetical protein